MRNGVVIKVGGSLLDWPEFPGRLGAFLGRVEGRALLVVGGGKVVDGLRAIDTALGLGEWLSHALALRALDLTARVVAETVTGLRVVESPEGAAGVWAEGRTPVLAPRWFVETVDREGPDPLPESWAATTDSIAAHVARHLGAPLVLLKSTAPDADLTRADAARSGLVDAVFPWASQGVSRVRVVNLRASLPRSVNLIAEGADSADVGQTRRREL